MAQATAKNGQQQAPFNLDTFLKLTTPLVKPLSPSQAWTDGGTQLYTLPQSGLASMIMAYFDVEITLAATTITAGTFANSPYPAPFSIIKNLSLYSNQNLNLLNMSGWGWYKWVRTRYGIDPFATRTLFKSTDTIQQLGIGNTVNPIVPGATPAAGTYSFRVGMPIPIAYNRELLTGLLFLQNNSIVYTLAVQYGNITGGISATGGSNDLFTGLVGTGISVSATVKTALDIETFLIPKNYPPQVSMFMSVQESVYPINTGSNAIRPPVNDIYTLMMLEVINNGAPVSLANLSNIVFQYSGNIRRYQEDEPTKAAWNFWTTNMPPTDGNIIWDFGTRKGLPLKRDTYDAFNYTQVTDLQLQFNVTPAITGVSQATFLAESLRFIKQY